VSTAAPDPAILARWLDGAGVPTSPPLTISLIAGGRSNLTYALTDAVGERLVLRRPPGGSLLDSAHDMGREWRFISALHATPVPVPRPLAMCADADVIGAPFYVMGFVDGLVVEGQRVARTIPERDRHRFGLELVGTMARLHAVDPAEVGLADIAKSTGYLDRQLRRWQRQWELSRGPAGVEEPLMGGLHADLVRLAPPQRRTGIVHGDFRLGNVISAAHGEVRAVLDWELATLGDPLADLGWLLASWRLPEDGSDDYDSPTAIGGFCSRADLIGRYTRESGAEPAEIDYYVAFANWRMVCILAGVSARYQAGAMGDDGTDPRVQAAEMARRMATLARRARELLG
jgi:aminoglycoside phosphotransferase (APT) family kinase protein